MSALIAKIVGARGAMVSRHASRQSGLLVSGQSFTSIVTMSWEWSMDDLCWHVSIYRVPIQYSGKTDREILWEGAVAE